MTEHTETSDVFPPSAAFVARAVTADRSLYDEADADIEAFWKRQALEFVTWTEPFHTVLDWKLPDARWFDGGTLNVSANCLDRHVANGLGDRVAFYWEGEPGDSRTITYGELRDEVATFANVLRGLGVGKGDRVAVYMPMVPEAVVAMLACTRIGAPHVAVLSEFSAQLLADRVSDVGATCLVTADGSYRCGSVVGVKPKVDAALALTSTVEQVVVVQRGHNAVDMAPGRDHWYHDLMEGVSSDCPPEPMAAEDLLFVLHTSGTTGTAKGIMHTTGGYLTQAAYTHKYVFDVHADRDVFWCTADIGHIVGHTYGVYAPLANAVTQVMYEGEPNYPSNDRLWELVDKYEVTKFYTSPAVIRRCMQWGEAMPQRHDLSSLKLLGTVGEPISPEAWAWYHEHIGGGRCPVVDTWWQTETGGQVIAGLPGVVAAKPGSVGVALPGMAVEVVDEAGSVVDHGGGYLVLAKPWPAMLRGIWGNPERYFDTYWSTVDGKYFVGDGAKVDEDDYVWVLGRVDDAMNVSGHRLSTAEVESALVSHPGVAEAVVVGATDDVTGQAIDAYVVLSDDAKATVDELRDHVVTEIGPIARPRAVHIVPDLPKTRSGKIIRRFLRQVSHGEELGDRDTLADPSVLDEISGAVNTANSVDTTRD